MADSFPITYRDLERWMTSSGGYTGAQLAILLPLIDEDPRRLRTGWRQRLLGVIIDRQIDAQVMEARDLYSPATLKIRAKRAAKLARLKHPELPLSQPTRVDAGAGAAIKAWAGRRLGLTRLRSACPDESVLADVLNAIDCTCNRCWDADADCLCKP